MLSGVVFGCASRHKFFSDVLRANPYSLDHTPQTLIPKPLYPNPFFQAFECS